MVRPTQHRGPGFWPGRFGYVALLIPIALGVFLAFKMVGVNAAPGETGLAATSLLLTGVIADPYLVPTGPTAHVSPLHTGLVAAVYGLLGANTAASRVMLSLVCLATYVSASAAVLRFCRMTGLGSAAQIIALLLTCILPFELFTAVISLRQWDQPFAALILMGSLLISGNPGLVSRPQLRPEAELALLAGLAALISPSTLPTLFLALLYTIWTRTRFRDWRPVVLAAVIVGAMIVPWGLRNRIQLGSFILTRSNFGLELVVGNHDGSTGRSQTDTNIHPHDSEIAARQLAAVGEVAYMNKVGLIARAWIGARPAEFVRLTLIRLRLLLLPDGSIMGWNPVVGEKIAAALMTGVAGLRLVCLVLVVVVRRRAFIWVIHCFLPLAPYVITHVNDRYEYPVIFTSICLVCTGADLCERFLIRKRSAAFSSSLGGQ